MASQFTNFISLELPAHGDYINTWEIPANANAVKIDALFSGTRSDDPNGTGHIHDGSDGQGPAIAHAALQFEGGYTPTTTHEDLDLHIADATIHVDPTDVSLSVNDGDALGAGAAAYPDAAWNNGPNGEDLIREIRFPGATITSPSAGVLVVDTNTAPGGGTGPATGVPTHLTSTEAPVTVMEQFEGRPMPLSERNWFTAAYTATSPVLYSADGAASIAIDVAAGSPSVGWLLHRIKTQIPHSEAQRVSLYVDRCDTADIGVDDAVSVALTLMGSAFFDGVAPSLGVLLNLTVVKPLGVLWLVRQIFVRTGSTLSPPLFQTAEPLSATVGMQGAHEFALDRNHALHYYYNNGPVDLGVLGQPGALTAYLPTLRTALAAEYAAHSVQSTPEGVAPSHGRMGFDCAWQFYHSDSKTALTIRHFAASSTEDVATPAIVVHAGDPQLSVIDVIRHGDECCGAGTLFEYQKIGDVLDVPRASDDVAAGTDQYRVWSRIPAGDAQYRYAGFKLRPAARYLDVEAEEAVVYCTAMGALTVEEVIPARPGEQARLRLHGARIPDLLDPPSFAPADPAVALTGELPAWAGAHPTAIPYPTPSLPGALGNYPYDLVFTPTIPSAGSLWPHAATVDDRVIRDAVWHRRDDNSLEVEFTLADGIPYGAALDLTLTARTAITNTTTLAAAVHVHPAAPRWWDVKFFRKVANQAGGGFELLSTLPENEVIYAVYYGRGLPAPITQAANAGAAATIWAGFPFDGLVDTQDKYLFIDASTGLAADATYIELTDVTVQKGRYDDTPLNEFPPTAYSPSTLEGETAFVTFTVKFGAAGLPFFFRAIELADVSLPPADSPLPEIIEAAPEIVSVAVAPDTSAEGNAKTVTVTGRNFSNVAVTGASAGVSGLSLTSQTTTVVVFDVITATANDVTFRITNQNSALYVEFTWTVDDTTAPTIASITPDTVTAWTYDQDFSLAVGDLLSGTSVSLSNATLPIRDLVVNVGAGTVTFATDVLNVGGVDLIVTLTTPNGDTDTITVTVTAPATPTISSEKWYLDAADYGIDAQNPQGLEIGQSGLLKLTGTGYRDGLTVTSSSSSLVFGTVTVISLTEIQVVYQIPFAATIGATVTITVTDRDGVTNVTDTVDIEGPTPVLTEVFVAAPVEGAGDPAYPAGAATVTILGQYFSVNGAAQVTTVTVQAGPATIGTMTLVDANTITVDELVIDPDSATQTVTLRVATALGKYADWSFIVQPHNPPIFSWQLHPGLVADPMKVPVIVPNSADYWFEIIGTNLTFTAAALSGPFVGAGVTSSETPSGFNITIPTINAILVAGDDPTIYLSLTVPGTATPYVFSMLQVDTSVGVATDVDAVAAYDVIEGSDAAQLVLTGTDLAANTVMRVELVPEYSELMPIEMMPMTDVPPISVTILSQTATQIVCRLRLLDNLAAQRFKVTLLAPDSSTLAISTHWVTVQAVDGRPAFDYGALPVLNTAAGASNDAVYALTSANGGEYLTVSNAAPGSVVQVATGDDLLREVQFDNPAGVGEECAVEMYGVDGVRLSVHRFTTTP